LDAAVGPAEARGAAAPHARHARSGTQFRDRNIFPFCKLQTSSKPPKIPQKFVLIEEIMGNPFCLKLES
jgi:hypothetical protein